MYMEVLRAIDGIAVFPLVSLMLFVIVFGVVLIRVARLDRARLDRFAHLPLDENKAGSFFTKTEKKGPALFSGGDR